MTIKLMTSLAAITMITLIISCGQHDETRQQHASVLESPPFAGITDSIKRFPDNPGLYMRRALMLSQMNQHAVATPDYEKAWQITGDENVALDLASNLILTQKLPEAVNLLEQSVKKFPDNPEFSRRLSEIQLQEGNFDEAIAGYDKMIAADSSNFEAWYDKGSLYLRMKDTAKAIRSLEKSFSIMPINYSGMALANIYVAQKNPRVLQVCDIILARDSAHIQTEPVYMKGVYYADINQYDKAIAQFDEVISRDWKMTDAYIEKGIILYERKQYDEALKVFNMTITVSNTDADGYYWLGRTYEATGKIEDAITNYQRALSLDKTFTEARAALRRLNS